MKSGAVTFFWALNNISVYFRNATATVPKQKVPKTWYRALHIRKLQQIKPTIFICFQVRQHSQTGTALPVALLLLQ